MPRHFTLHTKGAEIVNVSPGFFTSFLSTLIDPNIVSLLFLAGIVGPRLRALPPRHRDSRRLRRDLHDHARCSASPCCRSSWGGLALILLGVALLVIDLHVTSHGALTLSGLVAMAIGVSTLFNGAPSPYHTSVPLVVAVTVCLGGFWAFAMSRALALRRRPAAIGPDDVVGMEAVVDERRLRARARRALARRVRLRARARPACAGREPQRPRAAGQGRLELGYAVAAVLIVVAVVLFLAVLVP